MQVILRDDMDNLGKSGEVVNVKPGYARNYLLPRGHAIKATASDVTRVEHEKRVIAARTAKLAKEAQAEADKLSQVCGLDRARGRRGGQALRLGHLAATSPRRCKEQGVKVDPKKIHLDEPIKRSA